MTAETPIDKPARPAAPTAVGFPCAACAAPMVWDVGGGALRCGHCGSSREIDAEGAAIPAPRPLADVLALLEAEPATGVQTGLDRELDCGSCGAQILFGGTLNATLCPYCATPWQLADARAAGAGVPVDAVLPFGLPPEEARQKVEAWLAKRWWLPNNFKRTRQVGAFTGIYLPYFIFGTETRTPCRRDGEPRTLVCAFGTAPDADRDQVAASGETYRTYAGVHVLAATGLNEFLLAQAIDPGGPTFLGDPKMLTAGERAMVMQRVDPPDLSRARPYRPEYLAGFVGRSADRGLAECAEAARDRMDDRIADTAHGSPDTGEIDADQMTEYGPMEHRLALVPVYLLTVRWRDRPYQYYVNGFTGQAIGERPRSWIKVSAATVLAIVIFALIAFAGPGFPGE